MTTNAMDPEVNLAEAMMKPCEHCKNPIKEFHRSQCMWMRGGTPPCEIEKYERDKRRTRVGCTLMMMVLAGIVFTFWQFH